VRGRGRRGRESGKEGDVEGGEGEREREREEQAAATK
jgi:hypothetical protein